MVLFMFLLLAVVAFALGTASSPLPHRANDCHPNGTGFTLATDQLEWNFTPFPGLGSDFTNANDTTVWYWFSDQPTNDYENQYVLPCPASRIC
jgi:hypothetical protein